MRTDPTQNNKQESDETLSLQEPGEKLSKQDLVEKHNRRTIWKRISIILACFVVFCTTYALILPAITLSRPTYCGLAHEHVEACYESAEAALAANQDPDVPIDVSNLNDPNTVTLVEAEELSVEEFTELAGEIMDPDAATQESTQIESGDTNTAPGETEDTDTAPNESENTDTAPSETENTNTTPGESENTDITPSGTENTNTAPAESEETNTTPSETNDTNAAQCEEIDTSEADADLSEANILKGISDGFLNALTGSVEVQAAEVDNTNEIVAFTAKWLVNKTLQDSTVLALTPADDTDMIASIRLTMQLSGQSDYDAGTVQISIPKTLFKDRDSNDIGRITLSVPEAPDSRGIFSYVETDDAYVLTNPRAFSANVNTIVELSFEELTPHEMYGNAIASDAVQKTTPEPFRAIMQITKADGTKLTAATAEENQGLTATVDTSEYIGGSAVNYVYSYGSTWKASWPEELKPSNADQYYFVDYYSYPYMYGNQTYGISATHTAAIMDADSQTKIADGIVLGFKDQSGTVYMNTGNSGTFTKELATGVYTQSSYANHYLHCYIAYPLSSLTRDGSTTYTLTDNVTYTLTSTDDKDISYANGSGTQSYTPKDGEDIASSYIAYMYGIDGTGGEFNRLNNNQTVDLSYRMETRTFGGPDTADKNSSNAVIAGTVGTHTYTAKTSTTDFAWKSTGTRLTDSDYSLVSLTVAKPTVFSYEIFDTAAYGYYLDTQTKKIVGGTVEAGQWGYRQTNDTPPDVEVWGTTDGTSYVHYATLSWTAGKQPVTTENGATTGANPTDTSGTTIVFPDGVLNAYTTYTTAAGGVILNTYPTIRLKSTDDSAANKDHIDNLYKGSGTPQDDVNGTLLFNATTHQSGSTGNTAWDSDHVNGIGVAVGATSSVDADTTTGVGDRQVKLTYTASALIQTNVDDLELYNSFVNQEIMTEEESGTFYDLLPAGVIPDVESVKAVRGQDTVESVRVFNDFQGSGRTLLVIKMKLTPTPTLSGNKVNYGLQGYYDEPAVTFEATYSYEDLNLYGGNLNNVVAYQSANGQLGTVKGYTGEKDSNPTAGNNRASASALSDVVSVMTNLVQKTSGIAGTTASPEPGNSFVYMNDPETIHVNMASQAGFEKNVSVNGEGSYGTGKSTGYEKNVYAGGTYTYRLTQTNGTNTTAAGIVFYDSLEGYSPKADDDSGNYNKTSWQGSFDSVDLTALKAAGAANPKVYYSTKTGIKLEQGSGDLTLTNGSVWTTVCPSDKSNITAIAVDAGSDFTLDTGKSASVYVTMRAPEVSESVSEQASRGSEVPSSYLSGATDASGNSTAAYAFNSAFISYTQKDTASEQTRKIFSDSNYTKVGIVPFTVEVNKTWNDDKNRDKKRPDSVNVELYADGKATGRTATLSSSNDWSATFEGLSTLDSNGQTITYTVVETPVDGYTTSYTGSTVNGTLCLDITNTHTSQLVTVDFTKTWDDDYNAAGERPEYVGITLERTDSHGTTEQVASRRLTGDSTAETWDWTFSGSNLYYYDSYGRPYTYKVKESVYYAGYVPDTREVTVANGAAGITNKYDPYGKLTVSKAITGETGASKDTEFSYTLTLTKASGDIDAGAYAWTKYDSATKNALTGDGSSGTLQNGGTFTLKGGQYIVFDKIPSECTYAVTEAAAGGWAIASRTGATGTVQAGGEYTAAFTNNYQASGRLNLKAQKTINNGAISPESRDFSFQVYEVVKDSKTGATSEKLKLQAYNGVGYQDGQNGYVADVTFGAIYYDGDDVGEHTYHVYEVVPDDAVGYDAEGKVVKASSTSGADDLTYGTRTTADVEAGQLAKVVTWRLDGYSYVTTPVTVMVNVVDNGEGTLTPEATYGGGSTNYAVFDNTYSAAGETDITAWKNLVGGELEGDDFSFKLEPVKNEKGEAYTETEEDIAAKNAVPMPTQEVSTTDGSTDVTTTTVETVDTVKNDAEGTITLTVPFTQENAGNTYFYKLTEVIPDDAVAYDADGSEVKETGTENALKYSVYSALSDEDKAAYTTIDTWHCDGVVYSEQVFIYKIEPKDNGDGSMSFDSTALSVTTDDEGTTTAEEATPVFKNSMEDGTLTIAKLIDGTDEEVAKGEDTEYTFHVQLTAADGQTISGDYGTTSQTAKALTGSAYITSFDGSTSPKPGVTLTAAVTGQNADAALSYEWHKIDSDGNDSIVGENATTYATETGINATYYVVVTDTSTNKYVGYLTSNQIEASDKTIFAILTGDGQLRFYKRAIDASAMPTVGSNWSDGTNNYTIKAVYDGSQFLNSSWGTANSQPWYSVRGDITSVEVVDTGIAPTSTSYWFAGLSNAGPVAIDVSNLDTSNVTNMNYMFGNCTNLTSITLGENFDTSKVTNMNMMFYNYKGTSLDVSGFDTSACTNMTSMFNSCSNLTKLDVSGFDTSKVTTMGSMFNGCSALTSLDVSGFDTSACTNMSSMFNGCNNVTELSVSHFDTSNVEYMNSMFNGCRSVTALNLSGFNTTKVKSMEAMFGACSGLTSLDISSFNKNGSTTKSVANMYNMFYNCHALKTLDLGDFDTSSVTNMGRLFFGCRSLSSLDVSCFNNNGSSTSSVTNMSSMFSECYALTSITFGNFDTSSVTTMAGMFSSSSKLTSLDLSSFNTGKVTTMASMFQSCQALTELNLSNFQTFTTDSTGAKTIALTDTSGMFQSCTGNLAKVTFDSTKFDTSKVTTMKNMFYDCLKLTTIEGAASFNTRSVTNMDGMFYNCRALNLNCSSWVFSSMPSHNSFRVRTDTGGVITTITEPSWVATVSTASAKSAGLMSLDWDEDESEEESNDGISLLSLDAQTEAEKTSGTVFAVYSADDGSLMLYKRADVPAEGSTYNDKTVTTLYKDFLSKTGPFDSCKQNVKSVTVVDEGIAPTTATQWFYDFKNCTSIDVSKLDVSGVGSMRAMFSSCSNLTSLVLGDNFNAAKATTFDSMFLRCSKLTSLDLSGFKISTTANNVSMLNMFYECEALQSITFSDDFDTSKITNMGSMFFGCKALTELDLSGFVTSNVTTMASMFYHCESLTSLDLSGFDTSNVTSMSSMFNGCSQLASVDVSSFNVGKVKDMNNMFQNCSALTSLDLSGWNASNVTSIQKMFNDCEALVDLNLTGFKTGSLGDVQFAFADCYKLASLDLSGFTIPANLEFAKCNGLLHDCTSLKELTLGRSIASIANSQLPAASSDSPYTGKWACDDGLAAHVYTNAQLMASYTPSLSSNYTWHWQRASTADAVYYLHFNANGGMGGIAMQEATAESNYALPSASALTRSGYKFMGWSESVAGAVAYSDAGSIPANTYESGKSVILYAQWERVYTPDASGGFDVTVKGNQSVTIDGLPGGASYSVYEKTTAGWVLVDSEGTSGTIKAGGDTQAVFTNEKGGDATVTLAATKTLDGSAAKAGAYSFQLEVVSENGNTGSEDIGGVPMPGGHYFHEGAQTVTNTSGGAVNFGTITYETSGWGTATSGQNVYVYKITEVAGSDTSINYDTTVYYATVTVKGNADADGNPYFTTSVVYTKDSPTGTKVELPSFANTTANGTLELTKTVNGSAPTTGTFTFTLSKDGGRTAPQTITLDGTVDETETEAYKATVSLPAGTRWTLSENTPPSGYSFANMSIGGGTASETNSASGTIAANTETKVTVENKYSTGGTFSVTAAKTLKYSNGEDAGLSSGDFTFALYDYDVDNEKINWTSKVADTSTIDSEGNVTFAPVDIVLRNTNVGGTGSQTYALVEVIPDDATNPGDGTTENPGIYDDSGKLVLYKDASAGQKAAAGWTDGTYDYDSSIYYVNVDSKDNGNGTLTNTVTYINSSNETVTTPTFNNTVADSKTLEVSKTVTLGTPAIDESTGEISETYNTGNNVAFNFTLSLTDADGSALPGNWGYEVWQGDAQVEDGTRAFTVANGGTITLYAGDTAKFELPVGTEYTVTEVLNGEFVDLSSAYTAYVVSADGKSLSQTDEAGGSLAASSDSARAAFVNAYKTPTGTYSPVVTKELDGGDLYEGQFTFKLVEVTKDDKNNNVETEVATATNIDGTDSIDGNGNEISKATVTFTDAIALSNSDITSPRTFRIYEVNDGQAGVTYDNSYVEFTLSATDDYMGNLTSNINITHGGNSGGGLIDPVTDNTDSDISSQSVDETTGSETINESAETAPAKAMRRASADPGSGTGGDLTGVSLHTFKNKIGYALPQTGGTGDNIFYILGALLLGLGAVFVICKRRRTM